jgi:H+/Cl- antiporter ClcA
MAAITSGTIVPAGLFVPTLMSGAAYGRLIGNILNLAFPGNVASAGLYSLMGAAAVLGGVSRMTIAGAVIVIEACGSTSYLLPLMITFAAARYSGNAINDPIYEMLIRLKVRHLNKHIFITTIIITLIDLWSCIIQGITILRRLSQDTRIIKLSSDS